MLVSKGGNNFVLSKFREYRSKINSNINEVYFKKMEKGEAVVAFKNHLVDDLFEYELTENESSALIGNKARIPLLAITYIGMNVKLAPFNNKNFRIAIQYVADKDGMFEKSFKNELKLYGLIPKGLAGSVRSDFPYPYSLKRAKEFLSKSMIKIPIKIDFWIREQDYNELFVNDFSIQMKKIGLILNVLRKPDKEFYNAYYKRKQQMFITPLYVEYPEASHILNCFLSNNSDNDVLLSSAEVDKKLEELSFETNKLMRAKQYSDIESKILEEAVIIPLYQRVAWYIYNKNIDGVHLPTLGSINMQISNYYKRDN